MLRALTRPITQASVARRSIAAASAHRSLHTAPILARLAQRSANAGPGTPNVRQSAQRAKQMAERASSAPSSSRASSPFPSDAAFFAQVESTYARLRTGLGDMLAANPTMHLLSEGHSPPSLEVACGPDRGSFTFNVDQAQHQLVMFTPITAATYKYNFDSANSLWRCASDGHALEELFVRDIISTGLYDFPKL